MVVRGLAIIECSHMQKDKQGKKTDLNRDLWLELREKNGDFMAFE